jgi:hypothetical protein
MLLMLTKYDGDREVDVVAQRVDVMNGRDDRRCRERASAILYQKPRRQIRVCGV